MGALRIVSSTSIAIRLRRYIVVGAVNSSLSEIVGNSSGRPPASDTPRFTATATSNRATLQGLSSDHELQIPMTGRRPTSSAPHPAPRSHARRRVGFSASPASVSPVLVTVPRSGGVVACRTGSYYNPGAVALRPDSRAPSSGSARSARGSSPGSPSTARTSPGSPGALTFDLLSNGEPLVLESPDGDWSGEVKVVDRPDGDYDLVVMCVKSQDTRSVAPHLPHGGTILSAQNGVGNLEPLREHHRDVRGCVVYCGCERLGTTRVRNEFPHSHLVVDDPPLASWLQEHGVPTEVTDDIGVALWRKLMVNVVGNGLSAILRSRFGPIFSVPEIEPVVPPR